MSDYSKLRELAEAATPGERYFYFEEGVEADDFISSYQIDFHPCEGYLAEVTDLRDSSRIDAELIAATGPSVVLELLAEIERLRTAEGDAMTYKAGMENVAQQRDQLKAENERLRKLPTCWSEVIEQSEANDQLLDQVLELGKDAERYRWLRTQNIPLQGHDFLSSHEILDRRVDAKILKESEQ